MIDLLGSTVTGLALGYVLNGPLGSILGKVTSFIGGSGASTSAVTTLTAASPTSVLSSAANASQVHLPNISSLVLPNLTTLNITAAVPTTPAVPGAPVVPALPTNLPTQGL